MVAYLDFSTLSNYICKQKYVIIKVLRHYLTINLLDSIFHKNIYTYFLLSLKEKQRMKILIVDDNQVNLFVIEKILKRAGYEDFTSLTSAQEMYDYLEVDGPNK